MADPVGVVVNIALQIAIRLAIAALTPKQNTQGPRLEDREITTSTYGEIIPIGYGTVLFSGNVIWGREIREEAVTTEIGKGNPFSAGTNTQYYYYATFALSICEREIEEVVRIYADGKLIFARDGNTVTERMEGLDFAIYKGTETQEDDPIIAEDYPEGEVPGYRGVCYLVFNDLPLENFGNRIPQFQVVVTFNATEGGNFAVGVEITEPYNRHLIWDGLVYCRERDLIYATGFTDAAPDPPFGPFYYTISDATTGERQALIESSVLTNFDTNIPLPGTTDGWTINSDKIGSGDASLSGGGGPWLYRAGGGPVPAYEFIRKDSMSVVRSTKIFAGAETPYTLYNQSTKQVQHYFAGGGGSTLFPVGTGFRRSWYLIGLADGVTNLREYDYEAGGFYGSLRGRGYYTISPVPDLERSYHGKLTEDRHHGFISLHIGRITDSYTDLYALSMGQFGASRKFSVVRFRVRIGGGAEITELTHDRPTAEPSGGPTADIGTLLDEFVTPGNTAIIYDQATDTLGLTGTRAAAYGGGQYSVVFDCNSDAFNPGLTTRYELPGTTITSKGGYDFWNPGSWIIDDSTSGVEDFLIMDPGTGETTYVNNAQSQWTDINIGGAFPKVAIAGGWDPDNGRWFQTSRIFGTGWIYVEGAKGRGTENLRTVVEDICTRSKLTLSDIDASALATKEVRGYPVQQNMNYRSALEPLAAAYNFYGVEKDGQIVFEFKDGVTDKVIPEDDLIIQEGQLLFQEERLQDPELPRAVYISYMSGEADWLDNRAGQVARRTSIPAPTMQSVSEVGIDLPLTLSDEEAEEIVQRILYEQWVSREGLLFQLPQRYIDLIPNDVVEITAEGRTENLWVQKLSISADLLVEVDASVIDGSVYALNVTPVGVVGSPEYQRPNSVVEPTSSNVFGFVLDVPYLNETYIDDTQAAMLFAAGNAVGATGVFPGASVATSINDAPWVFRAITSNEMAWGVLRTTMPDIPDPCWNSVQTASIEVDVIQGDENFVSVTQEEMIGEDANTAILYRPDTNLVEVIGFTTAVDTLSDNSNRRFILSDFMRGKRGTDPFASNYSGVTYIILANDTWITAYFEKLAFYNVPMSYAVAPVNLSSPIEVTDDFTYEFRTLRPWAPCHAAMDDDTNGRLISWFRRTRYNGDWVDNTGSVPLNEQGENYEVDILDGTGGAVVRTLESTTASVLYEDADIATDWGGSGVPDPLYVRVYQLSASVGRGFSHEFALTLED